MEPTLKAIKLNFSKQVKLEFIRMSDAILKYIQGITPPKQELITFGIHSYEDSADTFKAFYEDGIVKRGSFDNIS